MVFSKKIFETIYFGFGLLFAILLVVAVAGVSFYYGGIVGYQNGVMETTSRIEEIVSKSGVETSSIESADPTPRVVYVPQQEAQTFAWGGVELWDEVNRKRIENGVAELSKRDEICTIASIRLNELLELGKLDAHAGFSSLPERREDLVWIYEKYNLSEFLVSGATSATEAVELWENTLGHSKLLTGGEYVWGCTYAQSGIGVAIAAY